MKFLGTGAAEMYPNPYCECEVCTRARQTGSDLRLRAAFMIDEANLIDFGQDILAASTIYRAPLSRLENVFITHTHDDHFSIPNIGAMTMADKRRDHLPIRFYMSAEAVRWVERYMDTVRPLYDYEPGIEALIRQGRITLNPVEPYTWFEAGGMRVFCVKSNHRVNASERALNYLFELKDGRRLLYAADTGLYEEENLNALKDARVDLVIMEGTFGSHPLQAGSSHLDAYNYVKQLRAFMEHGIVTNKTVAYVTHINQINTFSRAQYQMYMNQNAPITVRIAADGEEI